MFATTSVFSWQNSISLSPASFCTPRPNLLVWVLVLEGLVGLHRTVQFQVLQCYRLGHRLGLL